MPKSKKNKKRKIITRVQSSFRDPSGFLYLEGGILYRKIASIFSKHYEYGKKSGFYNSLIEEGLLISHREIKKDLILPQKIPFISYPYEWCFSQLKDAALLTLKIQKRALDFGMILKDGSSFNVQFWQGKPIFIDTLSFERYKDDSAWLGYRQFCQHFLGPLLLMKYQDLRLNQLSRIFIDGAPLNLVSSLLPASSFLKPLALFHIHFHAKSQEKFAQRQKLPGWRVSKKNLTALIESLEAGIKNLAPRKQETEWRDYYAKTNYSDAAFEHKKEIVREFLETLGPKTVWDLGANTGEFSRLAAKQGREILSFDIDPAAVESNYLQMKKNKEKNLLPLVMDFTNPSPGIGWENQERMSLQERGTPDCLMALALLHHLAISNNVPLSRIADYFSRLGKNLIVEFVPKIDSQVERLLATRKDIFAHYEQKSFEKEFNRRFIIRKIKNIIGSKRVLYLMKRRAS